MILTPSELTSLADAEAAQPLLRDGVVHQPGTLLQRDRIALLADRACSQVEGDIIEIGVYVGATSEILARIARKYDRKLICVDTFQGGDDYHLDEIGKIFEKNMQPYSDVLLFIHDSAHAPQVIELLQKRRYSFSLCDNGHEYEDHLIELETLLPVTDGLIAVDDADLPDTVKALEEMQRRGAFEGWEWLIDRRLREDWLVKR